MNCWFRCSFSRLVELEGEGEGGVRKVLSGRKVRLAGGPHSAGFLVFSGLLSVCALCIQRELVVMPMMECCVVWERDELHRELHRTTVTPSS
jgi:hypothetical protein